MRYAKHFFDLRKGSYLGCEIKLLGPLCKYLCGGH